MESLPQVVIVDLGSQLTPVIERTLRELGVRSVVLEPKRAGKWLVSHEVRAIILSGGPASVYETNAPRPPREIFGVRHPDGDAVPILGICYGMQWLAQHFGGHVTAVQGKREYGAAIVETEQTSIFLSTPHRQKVWASHGDSVTSLPPNFEPLACSENGALAAMVNEDRTIYGVQFHPEVTHTEFGPAILDNFLTHICRVERDWQPADMITQIRDEVAERVGSERAIFGFSGGVDSTALGAALSQVLGQQLLGITVDGGHLRENELDEITLHAQAARIQHQIIDASASFEEALSELTDAEEKRSAFKLIYTQVLRETAIAFGAKFILQGTLAPDRIESGATGGAKIKSHHNVGNNFGDLIQLHPISHLFKYEVRALAKQLGLPESVCSREPFPGPGLFLRIVGTPATPNNLDLLRWAEARVREIVGRHPIRSEISQLVTYYAGGVKLVCVKGDARSYASPIVVRPFKTVDFMTGTGVELPSSVKREIQSVLCQHREISSVLWEETDKPPRTTEAE